MSTEKSRGDEAGLGEPRPLGMRLAELVSAVQSGPDGHADPERVLRLAVTSVPHAEHGAITLVRPGSRPITLAATGPLPTSVDHLQYSTGEGPCLHAAQEDVAHVDDLETDGRWPTFGRACVSRTGIRSVLSVGLALGGRERAAMNLYATGRSAFAGADVGTAALVAPFAAVSVQAVLRRTDAEHLTRAVVTNREIGTAVGIVMAVRGVRSQEAFTLLRGASNRDNRKLVEVAADVVRTGRLPAHSGSSRSPSRRATPGEDGRDRRSRTRSSSS